MIAYIGGGEMMAGKEALIALANGEKLQAKDAHDWKDVRWDMPLAMFDTPMIVFRLKPRTITINGIEVPAPFEPKLDDVAYYLTTTKNEGYTWGHFHPSDAQMTQFGAWRTEEEIRQVVAALRSIFK